MDSQKVWSHSVARASLTRGGATHNPTLAAAALLGKRTVRRAALRLSRGVTRRRSYHKGNPLPAIGGILGGLPQIGRRVDPKKHAQRAGAIDALARKAATGDKGALDELERVANGLAWPGQWADLRAYAQQHFQIVTEHREKEAAAASERAGAAADREARFLEAGTTVGSALASGLGRSLRRRAPRRKRRRRVY